MGFPHAGPAKMRAAPNTARLLRLGRRSESLARTRGLSVGGWNCRERTPKFGPCFFNGTPDFRFDLLDGRGTCYVGDNIATAAREKLREHVRDVIGRRSSPVRATARGRDRDRAAAAPRNGRRASGARRPLGVQLAQVLRVAAHRRLVPEQVFGADLVDREFHEGRDRGVAATGGVQ
jgi:hypothetical protein